MLSRVIAGLVLCAAIALPAQAQFGGLAKKMKDKAGEAAAAKTGIDSKAPAKSGAGESVSYDDDTVELTAPRVDALLKGLVAAGKAGAANGGVAAVLKRREELEKQMPKLAKAANKASGSYAKELSTWSGCATNARQSLGKGKKADAAVTEKCGAEPAKPQAMVDLERANAQRDSLDVQARGIEGRGAREASKASRLTETQFAIASERALMALKGKRSGFSKAELAALDARKGELLSHLK